MRVTRIVTFLGQKNGFSVAFLRCLLSIVFSGACGEEGHTGIVRIAEMAEAVKTLTAKTIFAKSDYLLRTPMSDTRLALPLSPLLSRLCN
jgi:hypothetical protein